MDGEAGRDQSIGGNTPLEAELVRRLRWADDAVGLQVGPCLVEVDPIGDHGDSRHPIGNRLGRDVVEQRVKAGDQGRTRFERARHPAPQPTSDGVLEQSDRRPHVGHPVGSPPQERDPPRHWTVERRQASGDDPPVRHRVLAVDGELVGVAPADGLGHGLGGGAMAGAGVREKKDEALGDRHHRQPTGDLR